MENNYNLNRFIEAQNRDYDTALAEIRAGKKASHWMWYIFPQLKGLGRSSTSEYYGLSGIKEAQAYLSDPILKARLIEITDAVIAHKDKSAEEIFGGIDAKKLRSCMTLFSTAAPDIPVFEAVLEQFFHGVPDRNTLRLTKNNE